MQRHDKTSERKRTTYVYYGADGKKLMELIPGENGVTEALIDELHAMDDAEVNEQRRYEYRIAEHLDAYRDGDGLDTADRNKRLADNRLNPEEVLIAGEEAETYAGMLARLSEAMNCLEPRQRELFKKKYVDKRANTDIAAEEGVSETAIRKRLCVINEKIQKILLKEGSNPSNFSHIAEGRRKSPRKGDKEWV